MKTKICVSVKARTVEELEDKASKAFKLGGDLVEVRLDYLEDISIPKISNLFSKYAGKIIATLRPRWEGGVYEGDEESRLSILKSIARLNPKFIDIEYNVAENLDLSYSNIGRIISWHNFNETPSLEILSTIVDKCLELGDIVKIVTMAKSLKDSLNVLKLYNLYPREKLVAFNIGEYGLFSRILSASAGSPIIYTCLPG
ncbi:MAG: type I 3-dehydroquinate dehydratase, partial [Nitrososphaerota archaeon]